MVCPLCARVVGGAGSGSKICVGPMNVKLYYEKCRYPCCQVLNHGKKIAARMELDCVPFGSVVILAVVAGKGLP